MKVRTDIDQSQAAMATGERAETQPDKKQTRGE